MVEEEEEEEEEEVNAAAKALQERQLRILDSIDTLSSLLLHSSSLDRAARPGLLLPGKCVSMPTEGPKSGGATRNGETMEQRLSKILVGAGATGFLFNTVPSDYYERSYEERRDLLGAASVDHLCKSIVMVNTQAHESVKDCSNWKNSKYYVIVIQYTARLSAEKVKSFVYTLNEGTIPKKRFNLRLAPEEESNKLTGYERNAVTPIGMRTDIPVILSETITNLSPGFFWLGGGEVDLKLGIKTDEFIRIVKPFVTDCTY